MIPTFLTRAIILARILKISKSNVVIIAKIHTLKLFLELL